MMKRLLDLKKNSTGFTLVELMIVVAIIGILAAIAIPQFSTYRKKGFVATTNSDCKNAFTASTAFIADNPAAAAMTLNDLLANGYVATPGVATTVPVFADSMTYQVQAAANATWALNQPNATLDTNGLFVPAAM